MSVPHHMQFVVRGFLMALWKRRACTRRTIGYMPPSCSNDVRDALQDPGLALAVVWCPVLVGLQEGPQVPDPLCRIHLLGLSESSRDPTSYCRNISNPPGYGVHSGKPP